MMLGWIGQAVFTGIMRKVDRAGLLDDVYDGADLSIVLANGIPPDTAQRGLDALVKRGVVQITEIGVLVPNFIEAQEASMSNAERCRKYREVRRDSAKLKRNVLQPTQDMSSVTQANTRRHDATRGDTPSLLSLPSDPSLLSDPSVPNKKKKEEDLTAAVAGGARIKKSNSKPRNEPKSSKTWDAYSSAYQSRYGRLPVRNAKTNSICCRLIDYLGADIAPNVAAYYLTSSDQLYVRSHHDLALLLRDYQRIHTEWETGNRMTGAKAAEADRLQATGDAWQNVMAERDVRRRRGE